MATLDQRLQVLIDEPRLRRVREAAASEGVPVGQWIRDLIDDRFGDDGRADAFRALFVLADAMEPLEGDALEELHAARDARADQLLGLAPSEDADRRST